MFLIEICLITRNFGVISNQFYFEYSFYVDVDTS